MNIRVIFLKPIHLEHLYLMSFNWSFNWPPSIKTAFFIKQAQATFAFIQITLTDRMVTTFLFFIFLQSVTAQNNSTFGNFTTGFDNFTTLPFDNFTDSFVTGKFYLSIQYAAYCMLVYEYLSIYTLKK